MKNAVASTLYMNIVAELTKHLQAFGRFRTMFINTTSAVVGSTVRPTDLLRLVFHISSSFRFVVRAWMGRNHSACPAIHHLVECRWTSLKSSFGLNLTRDSLFHS